MEEFYTDEFKEFFNKLNKYEREVILWCSVNNHFCPEEYFKLVLETIEEQHKQSLTDNYIHRDDEDNLLDFDKEEEKYLRSRLDAVDGTLLMSIVWDSLKKHKIFIYNNLF